MSNGFVYRRTKTYFTFQLFYLLAAIVLHDYKVSIYFGFLAIGPKRQIPLFVQKDTSIFYFPTLLPTGGYTQEKKAVFLRFFKVPGINFITTVKPKI